MESSCLEALRVEIISWLSDAEAPINIKDGRADVPEYEEAVSVVMSPYKPGWAPDLFRTEFDARSQISFSPSLPTTNTWSKKHKK